MNKDLIIIYVKKPGENDVKTRLAEGIGREKATEIYKKLLGISRFCVTELPVDIMVSYGNEIDENDFWNEDNMFRSLQNGKDLGERMAFDFEKGFGLGYDNICLIGSDIPELTPSIIMNAFEMLERQPLVLGPTFDGGYYLVGLSKKAQNWQQLFNNIEWSTPKVLKQTLKAAKNAKLKYNLVEKLKDIDVKEDLNGYEFLLEEGEHLITYGM